VRIEVDMIHNRSDERAVLLAALSCEEYRVGLIVAEIPTWLGSLALRAAARLVLLDLLVRDGDVLRLTDEGRSIARSLADQVPS
jgi:hypothetical protein